MHEDTKCCQIGCPLKEYLNILQSFKEGLEEGFQLHFRIVYVTIGFFFFFASTPKKIGKFSVTASFIKPIFTAGILVKELVDRSEFAIVERRTQTIFYFAI